MKNRYGLKETIPTPIETIVTRWEDELYGFAKAGGFNWENMAQDRDWWKSIEDRYMAYGVA